MTKINPSQHNKKGKYQPQYLPVSWEFGFIQLSFSSVWIIYFFSPSWHACLVPNTVRRAKRRASIPTGPPVPHTRVPLGPAPLPCQGLLVGSPPTLDRILKPAARSNLLVMQDGKRQVPEEPQASLKLSSYVFSCIFQVGKRDNSKIRNIIPL